MKRVGHGGTLDPFATGVLVVAVGQATRTLQFVQESDKRYVTEIVLGVETDTLDVDGAVVARHEIESWPSLRQVEDTVAEFIGDIQQVAPKHAAIKVAGRKLYELARAGIDVEAPTRTVRIHSIAILDYSPPSLVLAVHCGTGTYIRSLARDIGAALGTGAYCHSLVRITNGPFCLADCWDLEELSPDELRDNWPAYAMHPDAALQQLDGAVLSVEATRAWYHGRPIQVPSSRQAPEGAAIRVYSSDGRFLGVGLGSGDTIAPRLVMSAQGENG